MAQAPPPSQIHATIGDVSGGSQVAVGNNIVQIGHVSGGIVYILKEPPPPPQLKPPPVSLLPKPFRNLLDRVTETAEVVQALESQESVECIGEPGSGKTSLLRHLARQQQLSTFTSGVVYLQVNEQSANDLLQSLFDAFYDYAFPTKPTETQIRSYLQSLNAAVLLDDVELSAEQIKTLINNAPNCTFIVVSRERRLLGEAREVNLKGLPVADAVSLFQRELGRALSSEEQQQMQLLCESLGCMPLPVMRAAHEAREEKRSLVAVVQGPAPPKPRTQAEKSVLAALAVFRDAPVLGQHVGAIAGTPNTEQILQGLEQRGLVQSHEQHYTIVSDVSDESLGDLTPWFKRALPYFVDWAKQNRSNPQLLAGSAQAVVLLIKWAVKNRSWDDVIQLGHAIDEALTLSGKWDMWAGTLESIRVAASAKGDLAEAGWALHQLGTRALLLGNRSYAKAALSDALGIRERLNDQTGAAITRHNLNILLAPPPPREPDPSNKGGGGGILEPEPVTPFWLKAGALGLVGLAAITALITAFVVWRAWGPTPPPVKPPQVMSFSVTPDVVPAHGQAQLCYEVANADRVVIEPNIGERKPATKECVQIMAEQTTTYTLTVFAPNGATTTQTVVLNVEARPVDAQIQTFEVLRNDGPAGPQFQLCYQVINAAHAEIDNDGGEVVLDKAHCQVVKPQQTTTYTLTATGKDGRTVTRQATVDATKPPSPKPLIVSFDGPDTIKNNETAELCFQLKDASTAQLDPGARPVTIGADRQCVKVKPLQTTTYTLRAFNAEGVNVSKDRTIKVVRVAQPTVEIAEFSVNPQRITRGDTVSLCFQVQNATDVGIEPGVVRHRPIQSGERACVQDQPKATTTYTLSAFNSLGVTPPTRQATITVDEPKLKHAVIGFFDASSTRIKPGESVSLCYAVADAKTITISPFQREFPNSEKNCIEDTPRRSTTYVLRATGEDGQTETRQDRVELEEVEAPPVKITRFELNPTMVHGTQLCYAVENARSARIDPDFGELSKLPSDCPRLKSLKAATYTLIATGADGTSVRKSVTYTPPEPTEIPIRILSFTPETQTIKPGAQAKICYSTFGEGSAQISEVGTVTPTPFKRCIPVTPRKTTVYTLTVKSPKGQTESRTVTVKVEQPTILFQ